MTLSPELVFDFALDSDAVPGEEVPVEEYGQDDMPATEISSKLNETFAMLVSMCSLLSPLQVMLNHNGNAEKVEVMAPLWFPESPRQ